MRFLIRDDPAEDTDPLERESLERFLMAKATAKGWGVFTRIDIEGAAFIIPFTGDLLTRDQYMLNADWANNQYLQVDEERFIGPSGGLDDLINHSCDPNCGLIYSEHGIGLFAIKSISAGQEICFDYSTTMAEDFWEMACCCGATHCRGMIRDFKHLPAEIRQKYIALDIVAPFIVRNIRH
jgi:hypothetical protein